MSSRSSRHKLLAALSRGLTPEVKLSQCDWRAYGLTEKQFAWAEHYLQHFNAARASRAIGCPGSPRKHGWRMRHHPAMQKYLDSRLADQSLSTDIMLARLSECALASFEDFITGERIDLEKAKRNGKLHLIKRYREGRNGQYLELVNSQDALELLAYHYGLIKKGR